MAAPEEESISPEPEVFEDPPSPHPSSDSEEFQSNPNSPEEPSDSETRYQVLGVPPRKEAKKVCGDITRLLRDKKSSTRGSRMFRKRRKRSERFSIVGYGTQPVDTDTDCSTGRDKTDSAYSLGSTDDEIAAYDRPGPHNVLERENRLSTTEQLLHNQHRHLAMDAAQMKGKGAKLFARRQRRMEKYVLEKKNEEKSETSDADSTKQNGRCQQEGFVSNLPNLNSSPQMSDERGFTPVSFSNIHSSVPDHLGMDRPRKDEFSENGVDVKSSRRRSGSRTRPSSRMPWTNGSSGRFASADWSTDDESADRGRPITAQQKGPQIAYRKVQAPTAPKPPIAPTLNIDVQKATRDSGVKTNNVGKAPDSAGLSFIPDTPTKSWRSVRFVPRKGRPQTPAQSPQVAYPCIYEKEKIPTPQPTHQPAPVLQPTRVRAWSKAPCARTTTRPPPTATQPQCSPSVALLQQPLQARSPSPFRSFEHISATPHIQPTVESNQEEILQATRSLNISSAAQQTNQIEITSPLKTDMAHSSAVQEVILPGTSHTVAQLGREDLPSRIHFEEENDVENELALLPPCPKVTTQQLVLPRPHSAIQPSNTNVAPSLQPGTYQSSPIRGITPQPSTAKPESGKPKIAACLKLLDPTKGKYEPKMELVYKQTPTLGAMLDGTTQQSLERPQSRNSYVPQQFNKPIVDNQGIPPSKYSRPTKPPKTNESPVSLGSIAGAGLRGKGARIFEKQQQRMQRYTQEASGCKQQEPPPEAQPSHYRKPLSCSTQPKPAPAVRTKENMGHVLGEFRKFSDSESPKRPSANRKGRSRDPCHYQHYYVARRPPSAIDFVCTDDAMSDTNSATSSLSSSYDLGSTCSSRRLNGVMQRNDDVREAHLQRGPPPKVAPKPKLERFLSADPTLVTNRPGETKDDGDNIDVNHQFGINNGESHNAGEENGGSFNSAPVNGDREISKPAFSVWSPGSGSSEMPAFPKLPPPPNYHDVTPAPSVIPRPTFNAIKHVQQAVNGVIPVIESPPQVTVAKPRFTTTKTPETWKPKL